MDSYRLTLLGGNIHRFWRRSCDVQQQLLERLAGEGILNNIAGLTATDPLPRLLRYPLLTTTPALRERLYQRLHKQGMGVSKLYPAPLPQIAGLQRYFAGGDTYPNAASLAACLLTLPVHEGVSDSDVALMAKIVMEESAESASGA